MERPRITRRELVQLALFLGGNLLTRDFSVLAESPTPELRPGEVLIPVCVRQGDWLKDIAAYYDAEIKRIIDINKVENPGDIVVGQKLFVPVPKEDVELPFKQIAVPVFVNIRIPEIVDRESYEGEKRFDKAMKMFYGVMAIVDGENQENWQNGHVVDFPLYLKEYPGHIWSHTEEGHPERGIFAGMRNWREGDKIFLSRKWGGEGNCWVEIQISEIARIKDLQGEREFFSRANHRNFVFDTCWVETPREVNPDDRLMATGAFVNYKTYLP